MVSQSYLCLIVQSVTRLSEMSGLTHNAFTTFVSSLFVMSLMVYLLARRGN